MKRTVRRRGMRGVTIDRHSACRRWFASLPPVWQAALAASLSVPLAPAQAQSAACTTLSCVAAGYITAPITLDHRAPAGAGGGSGPFIGDCNDGQRGQDGGKLELVLRPGTQIAVAPWLGTPSVRMESHGGQGGAGGGSGLFGDEGLGGAGGRGGDVTISGAAVIRSQSTTWGATAMQIISQGGAAGRSYDQSNHPASSLGGDGGTIRFEGAGRSEFSAQASGAHALALISRGGAGADGRILSSDRRSAGGPGGKGGDIIVSGLQGTFSTTGSQAASAIQLQSLGGRAGDTDKNGETRNATWSTPAPVSGAGGAIRLTLGAAGTPTTRVTTTGQDAAGVEMLSAGGDGGYGGWLRRGAGRQWRPGR